jgi:hypothetical protein
LNGEFTENRTDWCVGIKNFYEDIYGDSSNLLPAQLDRLEALRVTTAEEPHIYIPHCIMESSRSQARSNRFSAAGSDSLQWHHLLLLPPKIVAHFRTLFEHRLNNLDAVIIQDWCNILVTLIPKCNRVENLDQLRPRSLTSCLQKWYVSVVSQMLHVRATPLSINCIGFVRNRQPIEITETVRQLLQRKHQRKENVAVMQLDIKRAFDNIHHDMLVDVLISFGVPHRLILSTMRELTACEMYISLQGLDVPESVF